MSEKHKTVLSTIDDHLRALEQQSKLVIFDKKDQKDPLILLPQNAPEDFTAQRVEYWVAPRRERHIDIGFYTTTELQSFLRGLVPLGLQPEHENPFYRDNGHLYFGNLTFKEKIGQETQTIKRVVVLSDSQLTVEGFDNGKKTIESEVQKEYSRVVVVRAFPTARIGQEFLVRYAIYGGAVSRYGVPEFFLDFAMHADTMPLRRTITPLK